MRALFRINCAAVKNKVQIVHDGGLRTLEKALRDHPITAALQRSAFSCIAALALKNGEY